MNPIVSVFIATSLDGFIARENGDLDWLDAANKTVSEGEDCGYVAFMDSVDVLVMGRNTYEQVLSFGDWPYQNKPVIVLSSKPLEISASIRDTVSYSSESPKDLCLRLSQEGVKRIYIDGGITIQGFLSAGLVNDITITLIPVVLGSGKPLFGALDNDISSSTLLQRHSILALSR
ncbi:dihydrofolate reductase [Nitrospira defluvii]|nr:dihydrofolate reductase [Nitrospira defluvii]